MIPTEVVQTSTGQGSGGMPGDPRGGWNPPGDGYRGSGPSGANSPGGFGPDGPARRTDALSVVSLVAGILGLLIALVNVFSGLLGTCCVLCMVGSTLIGSLAALLTVTGLICGIVSVRRVDQAPEVLAGKGLAIGGAVISGIGLAIALATIVLPLLGVGCMAASGAANGAGAYGAGSYSP